MTEWGVALNYNENVMKIVSNLYKNKVGAFLCDCRYRN